MTVVSSDQLSSAVDSHQPGDVVKLKVRSGSGTDTVSVKLGERPASAG
jgi:S1-C subfamily serine protease